MRNSPESTDVYTGLFKSDIFCVAPNSLALKINLPILNVDISIVYEIIFSKDTLSWNPKLEPVCHIHAWSQLGESWRYCLLLRSGLMFLFTEEPFLNTIISVELGIPKCGSKCGFTHHFWKATGVARVTLLPGNLGWLVQLNNEPTPSIDPWKGEISCSAWGNSLEIVVHENQDARPHCNWPLIWFDMHVFQHAHLIVYRLPPNGNTYQSQ